MAENVREGPLTAARDFAEIRFEINERKRQIAEGEISRKHLRAALVTTIIAETTSVLVLYLLRTPRSSPLRLSPASLGLIDAAAAAVATGIIFIGFRALSSRRKVVSDLRLQLAQLREAERDARSRMPEGSTTRLLWTYHSDVLTTIEEYRAGARGYRRIHNRFQTVIIIGSLLTTAISTAAVKYASLEWAAVGVSFSVGVSAGMTGYFKFRERSMNLQEAADDLEQEYKAVELGIRAYRSIKADDRLVEFAERAERIKDEQRKKEQQLEQPPETRTGTAMAAPIQS